jgi:hypothetical protein
MDSTLSHAYQETLSYRQQLRKQARLWSKLDSISKEQLKSTHGKGAYPFKHSRSSKVSAVW